MSEQCCNNPIGFIRSNCEDLTILVENTEKILDAAGNGPNSGLDCPQAIVCINNAIASGDINLPTLENVNAVSGSYDKDLGIMTLVLSDGGSFSIGSWIVPIQPLEINSGGSLPTNTELEALASGKPANTIIWFDGTQAVPVYAWLVNPDGSVTQIQAPAIGGVSGTVIGYDLPSLADGSGSTLLVPIVGAALGGFVSVSMGIDTQGISISGWVDSLDSVSIRFQNETGGVIDLAPGDLNVRVL